MTIQICCSENNNTYQQSVINLFKTQDGDRMTQAIVATKEMLFKNIEITSNRKLICINNS